MVAGHRRTRVFATEALAVDWATEVRDRAAVRDAAYPTTETVADALARLHEGMEDGSIRTKSGTNYKPSAVRDYCYSADRHLAPRIGHRVLADLRRADVQRVVEDMIREGLSAQTVRNAILPLRVVCRRAVRDDVMTVNPCTDLDLPTSTPALRRALLPGQVRPYLDTLGWATKTTGKGDDRRHVFTLDDDGRRIAVDTAALDRAAWGLMLYAGLRIGEAQGLTWEHVDFALGEVIVDRSWDRHTYSMVAPKSVKSRRRVPMSADLRRLLLDLRTERSDDATSAICLRAPGNAERPVEREVFVRRAHTAWEAAGLDPINPHEARHTFGSVAAASGVAAWNVAEMMGHADVTLTANVYRHAYVDERSGWMRQVDAFLSEANADAAVELDTPTE
jgi:integrase